MNNELAAQLLFSHKLASREQILECWPRITEERNLGMLLVEKGILTRNTYQEMVAYIETLCDSRSQAAADARGEKPSSANPDPGRPDPPAPGPPAPGGPGINRGQAPIRTVYDPPAPRARPDAGQDPERKIAAPEPPAPSGTAGKIRHAENAAGPGEGAVKVPSTLGADATWKQLLAYAREQDAADIHLSAGNPILLRRYGSLQAATPGPMGQETVRKWVESALTAGQLETFQTKGDLELIYSLPEWGRYRVTLMKQRRGWDLTARVIPARIRGIEEAGLPDSCRELTKWSQGLVLVTGPVGCGKSSTLATLVEMVNQDRRDHIITIEEPIEIAYQAANCRITQRQIGPHTLSHDAALRAALREDLDIIVISELRDLDTIRLAVSAAETGHLVFGTMNTTNAARTLNRLIDSFPPEEQGIIRNMISESLRGVLSQQLLPRKDGQGMAPAFEVLFVNSAVANMIRKDELHQLGTAMITGKSSGMVLLDDSLRALVEKGLVDPAEAMARATNPKDFEKYAGRSGR